MMAVEIQPKRQNTCRRQEIMTKKDFVAIARAIAAIGNMIDRQNAAHAIADHAASVNPRFDRARFLAACGC